MPEILIKLTPGARKNAITGWDKDQDGADVLKVSVTAIAEKGKANAALIALLSKAWRVPKSSIAIIAGETSRIKRVHVPGGIKTDMPP